MVAGSFEVPQSGGESAGESGKNEERQDDGEGGHRLTRFAAFRRVRMTTAK